jgi:hypothetical protein
MAFITLYTCAALTNLFKQIHARGKEGQPRGHDPPRATQDTNNPAQGPNPHCTIAARGACGAARLQEARVAESLL